MAGAAAEKGERGAEKRKGDNTRVAAAGDDDDDEDRRGDEDEGLR